MVDGRLPRERAPEANASDDFLPICDDTVVAHACAKMKRAPPSAGSEVMRARRAGGV